MGSPRNRRVVRAGRLHRVRDRREAGETLIEGPHVLEEAIAAGADIREVFVLDGDEVGSELAGRTHARITAITQPVLEKLAPTAHPRGPVAVVSIPPPSEPAGDSVWTDLSDPGNAGTIIRTAAAFGFAVVIDGEAVDAWSPKVIRAAAGGHFRTTVTTGGPPEAFTVATVVDGGVPLDRIELPPDRRVCLLVGNEAHGLGVRATQADLRVTIPMPGGIESLNAGVAAAICLWELSQARRANEGTAGSSRAGNGFGPLDGPRVT